MTGLARTNRKTAFDWLAAKLTVVAGGSTRVPRTGIGDEKLHPARTGNWDSESECPKVVVRKRYDVH
jgi:hypothetical protein